MGQPASFHFYHPAQNICCGLEVTLRHARVPYINGRCDTCAQKNTLPLWLVCIRDADSVLADIGPGAGIVKTQLKLQFKRQYFMDIGTYDIAAPYHRIAYRTGFGVCVVLVLNVIRCSCHYFLDRILFHHDFHHDSCDYHWEFMAINYLLIYTLGFLYINSSGSANVQPLDVSAPGHSPWILNWTCFLFTPLCHVYIPY